MSWKALTDGAVTSTGTVSCGDQRFGGIILTADGTNVGTVTVQEDDGSGKTIFDFAGKLSQAIWCDIECRGTIFYTVSGTGASAQFFSRSNKG